MTVRRPRRIGADPLTPAERAFLRDLPWPEGTAEAERWALEFDGMRGGGGRPGVRELWERERDALLAEWTRQHPGTRPSLWWRFDAPRWRPEDMPPGWRDAYWASMAEPRRRVGGTGTAAHDCLAYAPEFARGIPRRWLTAADLETWANLRDARGRPARAYDPRRPPLFESQAAYLDRHGLLTDAERRALDRAGWPGPEPAGGEGE